MFRTGGESNRLIRPATPVHRCWNSISSNSNLYCFRFAAAAWRLMTVEILILLETYWSPLQCNLTSPEDWPNSISGSLPMDVHDCASEFSSQWYREKFFEKTWCVGRIAPSLNLMWIDFLGRIFLGGVAVEIFANSSRVVANSSRVVSINCSNFLMFSWCLCLSLTRITNLSI